MTAPIAQHRGSTPIDPHALPGMLKTKRTPCLRGLGVVEEDITVKVKNTDENARKEMKMYCKWLVFNSSFLILARNSSLSLYKV